jgi:hypothetical protein
MTTIKHTEESAFKEVESGSVNKVLDLHKKNIKSSDWPHVTTAADDDDDDSTSTVSNIK